MSIAKKIITNLDCCFSGVVGITIFLPHLSHIPLLFRMLLRLLLWSCLGATCLASSEKVLTVCAVSIADLAVSSTAVVVSLLTPRAFNSLAVS